MTISALQPEQLEESARVIREAFKTVADEFGFTSRNNPTNGAFIQARKLLDDYEKGILMYGLMDGDRQVGFVALENKDGETFYLEKLSVLPEFRHKGGGVMLLNYAAQTVRQLGGSIISIGIVDENQRLKNWYLDNGYIITMKKDLPHLPFTVCYMKLFVK